MKQSLFLSLIILVLAGACTQNREISDWRGPNRDGIYHETGLLKQWPEEGPPMLWSYEGLGYGHNSAAVANNTVYVTGVKDSLESNGTLSALNLEGELLWKKVYGKDFTTNFIGTRSTPVVVGDHIYIESGAGGVYCLNAENGEIIWSKDFLQDFGIDSVIQFGYSESLLIDGDHLICVPGGKQNNVVALNRFTGDKIWASKGNGEKATYSSPIVVEVGSQRLVIAMTTGSIMGIDADSGEMYWRIEHTQTNNIHGNTPIYSEGNLLVTSVDPTNTSGMIRIELLNGGKEANVLWRNKKIRNLYGGIIKLDSLLFGSAYLKKDWQVINWNTGERIVQNKDLGGGSIIYADGLFYCYTEKDGDLALVEANEEKFEIVSKFRFPLGN